jgi:hypothetical protein
MNTNKIKKILGLFDKYEVLLVTANDMLENDIVMIASPSDVIGESDNDVLYLELIGDYSITFSESGLNGASTNDNGNLEMEDTEGDNYEFKFQELKFKSINLVNEDID